MEVQGNQRISKDVILQVTATKQGQEYSRERLQWMLGQAQAVEKEDEAG